MAITSPRFAIPRKRFFQRRERVTGLPVESRDSGEVFFIQFNTAQQGGQIVQLVRYPKPMDSSVIKAVGFVHMNVHKPYSLCAA
jgi:hypothetical protein